MKSGWNIRFLNYFLIGNGHGPGSWLSGPRAALIHSGPRTGPHRWLIEGRSERRPGARNLALAEEKWGGDGSDPHRLQKEAAKGQK
jgi:hypothetical protein